MSEKSPYEEAREIAKAEPKPDLSDGVVAAGRAGGLRILILGFGAALSLPTFGLVLWLHFWLGLGSFRKHEHHLPGTEARMIRMIERCPRARRALGSEIDFRYGRSESSFEYDRRSTEGQARFTVPVGGTDGQGQLRYRSTTKAGKTRVNRAFLTVDGEQISLKRCGRRGKGKRGRRGKRGRGRR